MNNPGRMINACLILGIGFCLLTFNGVEGKRGRGHHRGGHGHHHPIRAGLKVGPPEAVFNVMQFDAKRDGDTDDAMAFIQAFQAACHARGPARVLIPRGLYVVGEIIFEGPCTSNPLTIDIQGDLMAVTDLSEYDNGAWIMLERVDNIIVTGGGSLNGRGEVNWQYAKGGGSPFPVSLVLQTVTNAQIHHLSFMNSMGFNSKVTDSSNIAISFIRINAPADSPNTDGIHTSSTTNISITDAQIGTGDDCISVGPGTVNMLVARITCGPGHGISIGSLGKRESETDVKGVTIINCTLTGTANGARIKTYGDSSVLRASTIFFQDILMNNVKNPIFIDQQYNSKGKGPSRVAISDVHFINIHGTTRSRVPVSIQCSSAVPCQGIEYRDVNLASWGFIAPLGSSCTNAKGFVGKGRLSPLAPICV